MDLQAQLFGARYFKCRISRRINFVIELPAARRPVFCETLTEVYWNLRRFVAEHATRR